MLLTELIEALSSPAAYPGVVEAVEVRQTHISVVFLAGHYAYKIKKPRDLGFVDFRQLDDRRHFCQEEVRLNRRLAASVYLGVVPVTAGPEGVRFEGVGDTVEWAVKMTRLSDDARLSSRLECGEVSPALIAEIAVRIAEFHSQADSGPHIAAFGTFEAVARNAFENFKQSHAQVGTTINSAVFDRLQALTAEALDELRALIERRANQGSPRDTHGDLHLDHIYWFPDRASPDDLVVIDCIEFSERYRYADPVSDLAFLAMDLKLHGRRDLSNVLTYAYFNSAGDEEGRGLLPFYIAYRAAVRGKVEGMKATETEITAKDRGAARRESRAHWLLALGELEQPNQKPCLVLVGGLPGTGKSTLTRELAQQANFCVIRSDVVRKELAGKAASESAQASYREGIYSEAWNDRTYTECLHQAEQLVFGGNRVIVDATFAGDGKRLDFLNLGARLAVPVVLFICQADRELVYGRLQARVGDPSDATIAIYEQAAKHWDKTSPASQASLYDISTNGTGDEPLSQALLVLRAMLLCA